jgi:TolB protein
VRGHTVLVLSLLAAGCARGTELIGYACGAEPAAPIVATPGWNCGDRCFTDENLPVPPGPLFAGPVDPAPDAAPAIVYPLAGSVHPLNLSDLTVQWRRDAAGTQKYFRLRVTSTADVSRRYLLYIPCRPPPPIPAPPPPAACTYPVPRSLWAAVAAENRAGEVALQIDATDPARGLVAPSSEVRISFAPGPIGGGVYYWSSERQGPFRALLGAGPAEPVVVAGVPGRFPCGGCHAVSRDGTTLAFSAQQAAYAAGGFLTVAPAAAPDSPTVAPPEPAVADGATMALSRDGSFVLTSAAGQAEVRETATGRVVARLDPSTLAPARGLYFPDWAPDGSAIVATAASGSDRPWSVTDGSIVVLPFAAGRFDRPRVIVPAGGGLFHFYPSWSPDGAWIAFVSAPLPGTSYANPQSRLRLVARDGGPVYELARATQQVGRTSTYPRFAPDVHGSCGVFYLGFQSKIDYGYLLPNGQAADGGTPQLWLSVIDVRALPGADPSSPPIWLPFQSPRQTNILATWTDRLVCGPASPCGAGASCQGGRCVALP